MKYRCTLFACGLTAITAMADVNLVTTRSWIVDSADDTGPGARNINFIVDKTPVGAASEVKVYFNFDGVNAMQIFSLKGSGIIQPSLPPPGEPGGVFRLTGYWDCEAGFLGSMAVTDLEFRSKGGGKKLIVRGKISNGDSLEATDVLLKFSPPDTNSISLEVSYRLKALRDLCVDMTHHATQEEFQVARMLTNFMSAESNQNDRIRLVKLDDRFCDPYSGCHTSKSSLCADLMNVDQYVFGTPRRLADPALVLLHRTPLPRNTPTLAIDFLSPRRSTIKGQARIDQTDDPTAYNVSVWGNWVDARKNYKARKTIRRFRYRLEARSPNDPRCDKITQP